MTADPSHISMTAKLAAYYRQFTDIPLSAEAAARIGAVLAISTIRARSRPAPSSRRPPVVVMQAAQHGDRHDLAATGGRGD